MAIMSAANATGSRVEVAAGEHKVVAVCARGENKRVVGDTVGLDSQRLGGLAQQVEDRPHHLRLTPQAVGVLDACVVRQMRGANCGAGHEPPDGLGRLDLAAMPARACGSGRRTGCPSPWPLRSTGRR